MNHAMVQSSCNIPELEPRVECLDTLFKVVRRQARTHPTAVGYTFLVDGETQEQHLTYGELDCQARAIAAKIQSLCLPGDHVVLLYSPGLSYIAALFACQYAGVIPVPAYPPEPLRANRTLPRLQAIVADCGATLALTTADHLGWLQSVLSSQTGLSQILATDQWQDWMSLPWTAPQTHAEQVALLQYTSGSTASPRGVMVSHRNLWCQFNTFQVVDCEDQVGVSWLPLYHDLGLVGGVLLPVYFRRRAILMSPLAFVQHPLRWLLAISRYRATTTGAPNFAFDLCVSKFSAAEATNLDLSSLRIVLTGAENVRPDTLDRFTSTFAPYGFNPDAWRPCYGLAEATLGATGIRFGSELARGDFSVRALEQNRAVAPAAAAESCKRLVGCGWALDGTEVLVVDPASRMELPADSVGEVWVRGPNVASGYWNRPEETEAVFHARLAGSDRGPFLRTGDLGFFHDGQLYLTGRLKEVMVFWGRNVYPQDVEKTVWSCHSSLKENACAAFAVESQGQEQLAVVQELSRPGKIDLNLVAEAVRQAILTEHQIPLQSLVFIKPGTLPKTSSGKTQRHVTRDRYFAKELEVIREWQFPISSGPEAGPVPVAGELPSQEKIRGWLLTRIACQCKISEDQIDAQAPLNRYILDSVSAVQIAVELQQWLGRAVAPTVLYDSPSLAVLAERLGDPQSYISPAASLPASVDNLTETQVNEALAQLLAGPVIPPSSR